MLTTDIQDVGLDALEAWCAEIGEPRYRAGQVLQWVHRRGAPSLDAMSNVSRRLRDRLREAFTLERIEPALVAGSHDGTQKLLFQLPGGDRPAAIESVLIPQTDRPGGARDRLTLCI